MNNGSFFATRMKGIVGYKESACCPGGSGRTGVHSAACHGLGQTKFGLLAMDDGKEQFVRLVSGIQFTFLSWL